MEDTRFVDLKVKVGFPYLYCHQGDCEHLVIITDIRSKQVLLLQSVSAHAHALELVFCLIMSGLKSWIWPIISAAVTNPGRPLPSFCRAVVYGGFVMRRDFWRTLLVTRADIKPSLVSLNCASQDLAANLVPRVGEEKGQWQRNLFVLRKRSQKLRLMSRMTFFFFFLKQAGPQERLPGQETVSASHTQAQVQHAEVQGLPRLHRKVRFCFSKSKRVNKSGLWILFSLQMVHHRRPVRSEQPLPLLWQVLPNAALWRPGKQAGRIPGLPICGPWCFQLKLLSERQFNAVWYFIYFLRKCMRVSVFCWRLDSVRFHTHQFKVFYLPRFSIKLRNSSNIFIWCDATPPDQ